MKKSKLFLTATLVLGLAGAVVAKAHTASVQYSYKDSGGACQTATFDTDPCPAGENFCTADIPGTNITNTQLYQVGLCDNSHRITRD